ncbi:transglutaminase family protein [Planctomicrobium piriforme]|uniref:Transglutaminase-like enzyme, putative cysteine protease n=1 Tax=Planctomicrobium piriforme TaxID=1576369 RepID=A0A1I3M2I2_9PLAN|nr:transglutaminase family protein [Planctomicrobium piriforme]SFI91188.1 Transglutaminase-like enzyme, putative cysteine protease [Planctomicrobium piriforme]
MNYKITHVTTYQYSSPVRVCHNYVMLTPREEFPVECHSYRLVIRPTPHVAGRRKDSFGNTVHSFSIEENHKQLSVTATSRVTVSPRDLPKPEETPAWETVQQGIVNKEDRLWLEACQFVYDSPRIRRSNEFQAFAAKSFTKDRPILEAARDLTTRIHKHFKYDSRATTVNTTPEDSFKLALGVCQDFAHVQVACLRSIGLPARYVSGYLRTIPPPGKPRLIGADQSHAWLSLYCGELGWIDCDPTNNCFAGTDHIPIAWGRDYSDVAPIKGVFLGGGEHQLVVSVDVCPLDEPVQVA